MVIMYGLKFSPDSEELWIYASAIGMLTISGLMDVVRIAVITIVELRKFEIRRRTRAGDILERRVKKPNESELQGMLKHCAAEHLENAPPLLSVIVPRDIPQSLMSSFFPDCWDVLLCGNADPKHQFLHLEEVEITVFCDIFATPGRGIIMFCDTFTTPGCGILVFCDTLQPQDAGWITVFL